MQTPQLIAGATEADGGFPALSTRVSVYDVTELKRRPLGKTCTHKTCLGMLTFI